MACNRDLEKEGRPWPRTCAQCGKGKCTKYPETPTPSEGESVWVLWLRDEGPKRVYFNEERAKEDLALLESNPVLSGWKLEQVAVFGPLS